MWKLQGISTLKYSSTLVFESLHWQTFYFTTAWLLSLFLFPCTTLKRKMVEERWWKIHKRHERSSCPIKVAEPMRDQGCFLCPSSPINHLFPHTTTWRKRLWKFSMWPPTPPHWKYRKPSQRLLKWLKIFTEESFRWHHRQLALQKHSLKSSILLL